MVNLSENESLVPADRSGSKDADQLQWQKRSKSESAPGTPTLWSACGRQCSGVHKIFMRQICFACKERVASPADESYADRDAHVLAVLDLPILDGPWAGEAAERIGLGLE